MNQKKLYVWRLAKFLHGHHMKMPGEELSTHLNRNNIITSCDTEHESLRGPYDLIRATWLWVHDDLGLASEAIAISETYVKADGSWTSYSKRSSDKSPKITTPAAP